MTLHLSISKRHQTTGIAKKYVVCDAHNHINRHEEALEHARSAVFYGQEREGVGTTERDDSFTGQGGRGGHADGCGGGSSDGRRARLATLAVSYYNLAVELEYTHRYEACLRW